jgi:hypothetical protein
MTPGFFTSPARLVRRAVGYPRVRQHLGEQDTTAAELRLALDAGILALDRRLLDVYALTETARREIQERIVTLSALTEAARAESQQQAESIEETLAAPESPLAELISAEAHRIDSYLVHHFTKLRKDLGLDLAPSAPFAADVDIVVPNAGFDVSVPSFERDLVAAVAGRDPAIVSPGVRALVARELRPGALAVDAYASIGLHALAMAENVGAGGSVVCFEPVSRVAVSLRRTLVLNGFAERADVRETALNSGSTLDAQLASGTRVDMVRLDLDGAEPLAWRGAERVRTQNPQIVVLMQWSASRLAASGCRPAAFMAEIRSAGFAPFQIAADDPAAPLSPLEYDPASLEAFGILLRRG